MGEFELIRQYFAAASCARTGAGVVLGIGDDCALLNPPSGNLVAVSTDTLVAGVHFPEVCDPALLGQRALGVSASDLAAMGASPLGFTLAISLPQAEADWLQRFAAGLNQMAEQCALPLIGGDTTCGPLSLTLSVLGHVPPHQALQRSGACVGDLLCVSGPLGDGGGALPLVLNRSLGDSEAERYLLARYWAPQPQLGLGVALRGRATAALDISDGLLADCGHIAAASQVCLVIDQEQIPYSEALQRIYRPEQALQYALSGGDDYQLAFTLPPAQLPVLQAEGWPIQAIGWVEVGQGVQLQTATGHRITPAVRGYDHFERGS